MTYPIHEAYGYKYIDEGPATDFPPIVCLHGLLGDVGNWTSTVQTLTAHHYRVLVPALPVYELPLQQSNVNGLVTYVRGFLDALCSRPVVLAGNSLGGQVALLYTLRYTEDVVALLLSGSAGIYEVEKDTAELRRRAEQNSLTTMRDYIRDRGYRIFYDPVHVTNELVDKVHKLFADRPATLRLIRMSRSSQAEIVTDRLAQIKVPTQLIWGRNDSITPLDVARTFQTHMPRATLHIIDQCGHAPMIEHPDAFSEIALAFLLKTIGAISLTTSDGTP